MTKEPVTVSPDAGAAESLHRMLAEGFRHLPVTEDGSLVGVVSLRDLSRAAGAG
jgi:CBS domain-containing protein